MPLSWLWPHGKTEASTAILREKRDQVLSFLENELDNPEISSKVEEVVEPLLPELVNDALKWKCTYMYVCLKENMSI